jgi:hypothetical protein
MTRRTFDLLNWVTDGDLQALSPSRGSAPKRAIDAEPVIALGAPAFYGQAWIES